MLFKTCMTFPLLWNTKEDILRDVSAFYLLICLFIYFKYLVTNIFPQSILFYVPQKKECHTCLDRHEEEIMHFFVNYPFKAVCFVTSYVFKTLSKCNYMEEFYEWLVFILCVKVLLFVCSSVDMAGEHALRNSYHAMSFFLFFFGTHKPVDYNIFYLSSVVLL